MDNLSLLHTEPSFCIYTNEDGSCENKKGDVEIKGSQGSEFTFAETSKELIVKDDVETRENDTKETEQMEPPQSPKMYLATGLGIDVMGGVDEEYYRIMASEDPCNPTYLKNYAQLLQVCNHLFFDP